MKQPAPRASAAKPARAKQPQAARGQGAQRAARRASQRVSRRASAAVGQQILMAGLCTVLLIAALPTALVLAFALLPTACAFMIDRSTTRSATVCVGALNVAGTWPFLLMLWTRGHTVVNAMQIIFDPFAWLIIYCSAAVGWLLYMSFPSLVAGSMSLFAGRRVAQLRQQQKQLVAEWGSEVSSHTRANPP
jgi:hypothetical protein